MIKESRSISLNAKVEMFQKALSTDSNVSKKLHASGYMYDALEKDPDGELPNVNSAATFTAFLADKSSNSSIF